MPYKINTFVFKVLRGFNKEERIDLGDGVTLLYGANGTGKSSLLQSIEWGITGNVPSMKGGDFTREDAIVNLFSKSKKATVGLSLSNKEHLIVLSRTRKMSTRTSSGKQPLEVTQGAKTFNDEEAEMELKNALGIDLEDFSRSKFLHQETIREVLNAKPEDRSQAIDKLIGIFEIREFSKTIDIERKVNSSIKTIQETLDSVKRDKIQFLLNLKRSLEETKSTLIKKGNQEQDLAISSLLANITQSKNNVSELSKKYGVLKSTDINIQQNAQSMIEAQKTLVNHLNALDRARLEAINRISSQELTLKSNSKRYGELYQLLQGLKQTDSQTMIQRIKEIHGELEKSTSQIKDIRQKLASLPHKRSIYETNKARIAAEKAKLGSIEKDFGKPNEIEQKIEKGNQEFTVIQSDLDKLSGLQNLLSMAIEHLEVTKTTECPVCLRGINNEELTKELKLKISDNIAASIKNLRESQKKTKSDKRALEEKLEESNRLIQTLSTLEKTLLGDAEQLRLLVPDFEKENLDRVTEKWENDIKTLSGKESELREEEHKINDILARLSKLTSEVGEIEKELQKTTSSKSEGPELIVKVEDLCTTLDGQIAEYSNSSEVDGLRTTLSSYVDILNYLKDESQVLAAEKELPMVENQIKGLEKRIKQLQGFASSVQSIKQIATQYEKEASIAELNRLEKDINNYYSQILGHPYFKHIKIDIEKENPLIFSIRAASVQEDTYIPTRFSTAQLNAVALAIFMSYNNQQMGELPIMILDDPTQNMDAAHKEAFAKLISTLGSQKQVIIATEDNDTKTFLEKYCNNIKTYRFGNWTRDGTNIQTL